MQASSLIILTFLLALASAAAQFSPCAPIPVLNSPVHFVLKISSRQTTFQQGQVIPLTLSFSTSKQGYFWLGRERYNDIGRSTYEQYYVTPAASDPLYDYIRWDAVGGAGLPPQAIGPTPIVIHEDLNAFVNLPPGRYRLYAITQRVTKTSVPIKTKYLLTMSAVPKAEPLRSNIIQFTVIPASPAWQAEQLKSILPILRSSAPWQQRLSAAHRLRFLNSRSSAIALASLFPGVNPEDQQHPVAQELFFGLYGSPYRQLVIQTLKQQITAPGHPVNHDFLNNLVWLEVDSNPAWSPRGSSHAYYGCTCEKLRQRRKIHERALLRIEARKLLAALPQKTGKARALSALGVLMTEPHDPALAAPARKILIASWNDLPLKKQQDLVANHWSLIDTPQMLPILTRMASGPAPPKYTWAAMVHRAVLYHLHQLKR
jgi:hypothetical protein